MNVRSSVGKTQPNLEAKIKKKAKFFYTRLLMDDGKVFARKEVLENIISDKKIEYLVSSNYFPICTAKSIIFTQNR